MRECTYVRAHTYALVCVVGPCAYRTHHSVTSDARTRAYACTPLKSCGVNNTMQRVERIAPHTHCPE